MQRRNSSQQRVGLLIVVALALFVALRSAQSDANDARNMASEAYDHAEQASNTAEETRDELRALEGRVDDACWRLNNYC